MTEQINLSQIRVDGGTQPRATLNMLVVDEYAEAMRSGATFPPVTVFYDGSDYWLADGFHRLNAAKSAGLAQIVCDVRQGTRRDAVLFSVGANSGHGLRRSNEDKRRAVETLLRDTEWGGWPQTKIAAHCGVTPEYVSRLKSTLSIDRSIDSVTVERNGTTYTMNTAKIGSTAKITPEVRQAIRDTPIADDRDSLKKLSTVQPDRQAEIVEMVLDGDARNINDAIRKTRLAEQVAAIESTPLPRGKFRVIAADPPWAYTKRAEDATHRGACPYPTMDIEAICAMPVAGLAHDDCILWLWTTNAFMQDAYRVAGVWGFQVKTILTWAKDRMGVGDWLRGQTEHCLMAVRGKPVVALTNQTTLLRGPMREHSRKPDEFYALVEALCPGTKCELFSRENRPGWEAFGAEVGAFDEQVA